MCKVAYIRLREDLEKWQEGEGRLKIRKAHKDSEREWQESVEERKKTKICTYPN